MLPLQSRDCNFLRTKLHYEQLYIFMVPTVLFLASIDRVSELALDFLIPSTGLVKLVFTH